MFRNLFLACVATISLSAVAVGQCNCGDCGSGVSAVPDSAYSSVVDAGCNSCGSECGGDCYGLGGNRDCGVLSRCRYLSFFGGGNYVDSFKESNVPETIIGADRGTFDDGSLFGFAVGSQVHPNVRYEIEGSFRENDADQWFVEDFTNGVLTGSTVEAATGELESSTAMVNFLFDFPQRQPNCWNFYGGFGIGATFVNGNITTGTAVYDVNDSSFAFQAIAGFSKALNERVDFFADYRYLTAQNVLVDNLTTGVSLGDFEYNNNGIAFGLRLRH